MEEPRWHLTPSEAAGINSSLVNEVADLRARVAELESRERRLRLVLGDIASRTSLGRAQMREIAAAALADAPAGEPKDD